MRVPVVVLDPSEADGSRRDGAVCCDNAAVARAAFRELSAGRPPSFAAVTYWNPSLRWAQERVAAFSALCADAKRECAVFPPNGIEPSAARMARLAEWAAALPNHVAIFAANDFTAVETAIALRSRFRHIPKTATLVGVDGSPERHDIPASPVPLSSVNVNFESAGFLAARTLAEILATKNTSPPLFGPLMVVRRESTRGRGRREQFVIEAAEAIRREACNGLTAAALAGRFPVSRKHFERRFREATGHSVLDEILYVRLEQVQAYLLRRDVAIDTIAGFCGFGSEIELRRLFRRRFGMSMSEWRARNSV
jgi:LacI family transcriptional regulator